MTNSSDERSLEERLGDSRPRVLVVDDNPKDLALLLRILNRLGEKDNLKFAGTASPREAYERLTQDKSFLAGIFDISYNCSPEDMAAFSNGTALARGVSKVRPGLVYAFMSGGQYGGVSITSIIQNIGMLQGGQGVAAWEKPSKLNEINVGDLYENIKAGILKLDLPKYKRLYIFEGPSRVGKTAIKIMFEREKMPWMDIHTPSCTRERRLVEVDNREFLTYDGMHEKIMGAGNPLVWALLERKGGEGKPLEFAEAFVFSKGEYLKKRGALESGNAIIYMLDLTPIFNSLSSLRDVMVPVHVHLVSEELRRMFGKYLHTISLYASPTARAKRDAYTRSLRELFRLTSEDENERPGDTVIETDYPPVNNMEASISQAFCKVRDVIMWGREEPYTADIHADYVERLERALSEACGAAGGLEPSNRITIPSQYTVGSETFLGHVNTDLPFTVKDVQTTHGVKSVRIVLDADLGTMGDEQRKRIESEALEDLSRFIEHKTGFKSAKEKPDFPGIAYALTDRQPSWRKDATRPYRLELLILG